MAQRFYQKTSFLIYIVTGFALIIAILITIARERSELRQENRNFINEVSELKKEISDLKKERDTIEIKLAPFLSTADLKFPDAPPEQRLDLLIKKMDEVIHTFQDAKEISPERSIPKNIIQKIAERLEHLPQLNVEIKCIANDADSYSLANQIKSMFEMAGWKVHDFKQSFLKKPFEHPIIEFANIPSKELVHAILPLFDVLGHKREAKLNKNLPAGSMRIYVGSK